jgi:hypothetical protein
MSDQPLVLPPVPPPPSPGRFVRIEYLGFETVDEHREFKLRVYGPDGSTEVRSRIAVAAFDAGRVRLQDGPDVCYRKLLQAVAAGEASSDVITIDDSELASYREARTPVAKHRTWTPTSLPPRPVVSRRPPRAPSRPVPAVALVANDSEPALEEGQRVSHAVFGAGVTTSSSGGHTVVRFDEDGPKTFVTSMLDVDVLSAPHTWETTSRGNNRPCPAGTTTEGRAAPTPHDSDADEADEADE